MKKSDYNLIFKVSVRLGYITHKHISTCMMLLLNQVRKKKDNHYLSYLDIDNVYTKITNEKKDLVFIRDICNLTLAELKRKYSLKVYSQPRPRQIGVDTVTAIISNIIEKEVDVVVRQLMWNELVQAEVEEKTLI